MHGRPGARRVLPAPGPTRGYLHSRVARRDGHACQEGFRAPRARRCGGGQSVQVRSEGVWRPQRSHRREKRDWRAALAALACLRTACLSTRA